MHNLVIYGAGGLGIEVAEMVARINARHKIWNFLGFVDDRPADSNTVGEYPLLGTGDIIKDFAAPLDVALAISHPKTKRHIHKSLKEHAHVHFPCIIDIGVLLSPRIQFSEGVILASGCIISVDVTLGCCTFVNTGTSIGHETELGDYVSVMPNCSISGNVKVGAETLVGASASILQGLTVGTGSTIGMGSVVLFPVPDETSVLGNPAQCF